MVAILSALEIETKRIVDELFANVDLKKCCPYVRKDSEGAYCCKDFPESAKPNSARRYLCDTASLQLWCLDSERYSKCIAFQTKVLRL